MSRVALLGILVCAACPGGSSQPAQPAHPAAAAPAGPTCASVMPKMTAATVATHERGGADADLVAKARADAEAIEPKLVELCVADRWSPELLACMDTTAPLELDQCTKHVTPEQEQNVIKLRDAEEAKRTPPEPQP